MKQSGQAGSEVEIIDVSVLINTGLKGIAGVSVITERGVPNFPVLIGSWIEYQRYFGGMVEGNDDAHIVRRCVEGGGRLKVSRVAHYSNIADKTTIVGDKSVATVNQAQVAGVRAKAYLIFAQGSGTIDQVITISVNTGLGIMVLGTHTTTATTTVSNAVGVMAAINAGTSTHGYSAAGDPTSGSSQDETTVIISAPLSEGARANAFKPSINVTGNTTPVNAAFETETFENGVTAQTAHAYTVRAKSIGEWGDGVTLQWSEAANGTANTLDLVIDLDGYPDLQEKYSNISTAFTGTEQSTINNKSKLVDFSGVSGTLCSGSEISLSGGSQDISAIVPADYIGDAVSMTGIHSFDTDKDIVKICVPGLANPLVDQAVSLYAESRKDIRSIHRTPVGLDGQGIIGYRQGTSPYSHTAIDTWRSSMFTGGLKVINPFNEVEQELTEIGDVLAAYTRKDNKSLEWFPVGGSKRGLIKNALGVVYDLGTAARQTIADAVDVNGVNAVIDHESFGPVIWGNSTLQKADTLLKHDNVADLMIALTRGLKPLIQSELFEPNDIETWKDIYRRVTPLMDYIRDNRGIWKYLYQGDQDIDDVSQAVVNSPSNIDNGSYIFHLFIAPKVGMKYQGVKVIVTNSGVKFEELAATI